MVALTRTILFDQVREMLVRDLLPHLGFMEKDLVRTSDET